MEPSGERFNYWSYRCDGNIVAPITLADDVKYSHLAAALNGGPIEADDDGDVDRLTGAAGTDTFFYHYQGNVPLDIVTDKAEIAFNK
jgi:hypothetical protein